MKKPKKILVFHLILDTFKYYIQFVLIIKASEGTDLFTDCLRLNVVQLLRCVLEFVYNYDYKATRIMFKGTRVRVLLKLFFLYKFVLFFSLIAIYFVLVKI